MANETTVQTSGNQENYKAEECRENIPPGVTAAAGISKLKVQVGDGEGYSSTQPSGENEPLSDICTFSTPAPPSSNRGVKTKSRISGLQSALTPILKYLNIGNKCPSPEPSKHRNNPRLSVPFSYTNLQRPTGGSSQHPNTVLSSIHTGRPICDTNSPVSLLEDEIMPEITFFDDTCDSTMQLTRNDSALADSAPAAPVTAAPVHSTLTSLQPSTSLNTTAQIHPSEPPKLNGTTASTDSSSTMVDSPESTHAPLRWLHDMYFPEITLLDVTRDSELSPGGEISSMDNTRDISPVGSLKNNVPSSELSGHVVAESSTLDMIRSGELSSSLDGNATHTISSFSEPSDKFVGGNITKGSLEGTRDISTSSVLENSRPSSELGGQDTMKLQTSAEDTPGARPINVTHDISSSSDMSAQCAAPHFSASDAQCNTSSKNVTSERHGESAVACNTEELLTDHVAESTTGGPQPSPKTAGSVNGTFNIIQTSNLSASPKSNTPAQISSPQNKTLDLPPSNVHSPSVVSEATDQATSVSKNTTETSPTVNQNCPAVNAGGPCDVQNTTFERRSLQTSSFSTLLGEAGVPTVCPQNNTFDTKPPPQQNGTMTLSETSSSDIRQDAVGRPSPPEVCNATKDSNSELSKLNGSTAGTNPDAEMADTTESTFEANAAVEVESGAGRRETKDLSQSGLAATDGLSDTLGHQSTDSLNNKANTFSLDDTLDLAADCLITSTPMINCKMFNFSCEREEGKTTLAQKKLYGDGPAKPGGPAPPDVPSNIICDRKTFLTQPAAKTLVPATKAASQLSKYKPASTLTGRLEPSASGLPTTRQRSQAEALRNTAASDGPQATTGISSSYNLRATTGSKLPNSGLRKPLLSGIPSGIHRAAPGLRPPSARSTAPASSTADKLRAPTATNPVTKISQAKKHPVGRSEALPIAAKRKKMDVPLSSGSAEVSTSSCDAANRAKNLKLPTTILRALPAKTQRDDAAVPARAAETSTSCDAASTARALKQPATSHKAPLAKPQCYGCANCAVLDQQVKMLSEENRRLKEELLKYQK